MTICHSKTHDLASVTRQADVLVVAIGRAGLIGRNHIKPGATVIDVGMNKVTDEASARALFGDDAQRRIAIIAKQGYTLAGDVNPAEADEVAGRITPVPGGVGLLTVAINVGYYVLFWSTSGQTVGHKAMGLRVVRTDGAKLDLRTGMLRWTGTVISGLLLCLGYLWVAVDRQKQGWHDKIAHTYVLRT